MLQQFSPRSFPARRGTALSLSVHQGAPSHHVPHLELLRSPQILTKPLSVKGKALPPPPSLFPDPPSAAETITAGWEALVVLPQLFFSGEKLMPARQSVQREVVKGGEGGRGGCEQGAR